MEEDPDPQRRWPDVMLIDEAAEYLRTTPVTLRHLARAGRVPARKVGNEWRFHRLALEDFFRKPQERQRDLDRAEDPAADDVGRPGAVPPRADQ